MRGRPASRSGPRPGGSWRAAPFRLLVVHNVRLGQGDDIVRLVPLLQALLDANPELRATLLANRLYLFDHPRVHPCPLDGRAAVAALEEAADGVIAIEEPDLPEMTPRGPCLLTGTPSADAERVWRRLRRRAGGGEAPARRVALVNAFGGSHRVKGFDAERPAALARELAGLVDEGHAVILLPPSTASWACSTRNIAVTSPWPPTRPRRRSTGGSPSPSALSCRTRTA